MHVHYQGRSSEMKRRSIIFAVAAVALTSLLAASATASTNAAKPSLKVSVSGKGKVTSSPAGVNCPGKCKLAVKKGASVRLAAHPATGWKLSKWSGACKGGGGCTVKLTSSKSVKAVFVLKQAAGPTGPTGPTGPGNPPPTPLVRAGGYTGTTSQGK